MNKTQVAFLVRAVYGSRAIGYIGAHHLVPLSRMTEECGVRRDPRADARRGSTTRTAEFPGAGLPALISIGRAGGLALAVSDPLACALAPRRISRNCLRTATS